MSTPEPQKLVPALPKKQKLQLTGLEEPNAGPLLMKGLAKNWPAFHKWKGPAGLDRLQELCGQAPVQVMCSTSNTFSGAMAKHVPVQLKCSEFLDAVRKSSSAQSLYLAQAHIARKQLPSGGPEDQTGLENLWEDIKLPKLWSQCSGLVQELPEAYLWMSSSKSSRSSLHYDNNHNLLCTLTGSKTVDLYSPEATRLLYPESLGSESSNHSCVDIDHPDLTKHPQYAQAAAHRQTATLQAGDALFIPEGWWHQVDSAAVTIAVSFWWPSAFSVQLMRWPDSLATYRFRRLAERLIEADTERLLAAIRPWPFDSGLAAPPSSQGNGAAAFRGALGCAEQAAVCATSMDGATCMVQNAATGLSLQDQQVGRSMNRKRGREEAAMGGWGSDTSHSQEHMRAGGHAAVPADDDRGSEQRLQPAATAARLASVSELQALRLLGEAAATAVATAADVAPAGQSGPAEHTSPLHASSATGVQDLASVQQAASGLPAPPSNPGAWPVAVPDTAAAGAPAEQRRTAALDAAAASDAGSSVEEQRLGAHGVVARVIAGLSGEQLRRVLLAMAERVPRSLQALLLYGLTPAAAQLLLARLEAADRVLRDAGRDEEQDEFYRRLYGVVGDRHAVLEALLRQKELVKKHVIGKLSRELLA